MAQRTKRSLGRKIALLIAAAMVWMLCSPASAEAVSHDIRPGLGVSDLRWLSTYLSSLRGTPGDTPVYVLRGEEPGGTVLVLGGTHACEIAGVLAATLLVERGEPAQGTVIVVPHTNNSAARVNAEQLKNRDGEIRRLYPFTGSWISLTTLDGEERWFRYGARLTQPADQGEQDPAIYVHASGLESPGYEARNLNRVHPGTPNGTLTEQMSHALFRLVEEEAVDVVIDMHEASPESGLAHALVCHPRSIKVGAKALLDLEAEGIHLNLEVSRPEYGGMSHWEFGESADVEAFLIETLNPGQDASRVPPGLSPIASSGTASEVQAGARSEPRAEMVMGSEPDVVNDLENPISTRVYEQLVTLCAILANHSLLSDPGDGIEITFPFELRDLVGSDLGCFLR